MDQYRLWEDRPADAFCDAHFLGNGRLGLTAYGRLPLDEMLINDDTLWSGSESFYLNEKHYESFREAQKLALQGDYRGANDIINNRMEGRWQEGYLPLGSVQIMYGQADDRRTMELKQIAEAKPGQFEGYSRSLDLSTAVETMEWTFRGLGYKKYCFVSKPADAAIVRIEAGEMGGHALNFAACLDSKLKHSVFMREDRVCLKGIAPDHTEPDYTPVRPSVVYGEESVSEALRFGMAMTVLETDGTAVLQNQRIYVRDASYAVLAIQAKTSYAGFQKKRTSDEVLLGELAESLSALKRTDYQELYSAHLKDYRELYGRVSLNLGHGVTEAIPTSKRLEFCGKGADDPSLAALMVQYVRYLLIAGSRPGTQPANLQGIWNDRVCPPWASNYTNNINVEMNYWACEQAGLPECHEPLMRMLKELSVTGRMTAEQYYHMQGWVCHHNTDLWRSTEPACEDATWSWWPLASGWMCEHIWTHYEYTQDREFLKEMYPVLREAVRFYLDFLTEDAEGHLVTAPSVSPENKYIFRGGDEFAAQLIEEIAAGSRCSAVDEHMTAVTVGSTIDMSILRELFRNTARAAEILGVDAGPSDIPARAKEAVSKFPPYKTGRYGQLLEWADDVSECSPGMGHISQMYGVYPSDLITASGDSALFEAARRSLERRNLHDAEPAGWPGAWRIALMARFRNPLECGHLIKSTGKRLGAGMLTVGSQQIDAIFGLGAGILEMLLQSHQGYIELIPAITVDWANGSFRGLRARGGFEVSASWEKGKCVQAEILSRCGGICAVKNAGFTQIVRADKDGAAVPFSEKDGIWYFAAEKGARFLLR